MYTKIQHTKKDNRRKLAQKCMYNEVLYNRPVSNYDSESEDSDSDSYSWCSYKRIASGHEKSDRSHKNRSRHFSSSSDASCENNFDYEIEPYSSFDLKQNAHEYKCSYARSHAKSKNRKQFRKSSGTHEFRESLSEKLGTSTGKRKLDVDERERRKRDRRNDSRDRDRKRKKENSRERRSDKRNNDRRDQEFSHRYSRCSGMQRSSDDESSDKYMAHEAVYEPCTRKSKVSTKQASDDGELLKYTGMSFHQAANFIPYFDGDVDNLNSFCNAVRLVFRTYGPQYETFLLLHIANRLTGKAAKGFRARTINYNSVETLLSDLALHYGNIGMTVQIYTQIRTITQDPTESASEYGSRTKKLYNRLITMISFTPNISEIDRDSIIRQVEADILERFLVGLKPPLDHLVYSRQPTTLDAAITDAIVFEGKLSARFATRSKISDTKLRTQILMTAVAETELAEIPNRSSATVSSEKHASKQLSINMYCHYCKSRSHITENCQTLFRYVAKNIIKNPDRDRNGGGRKFRSNKKNRNKQNNFGTKSNNETNYNKYLNY